jgi:hypothetical protein
VSNARYLLDMRQNELDTLFRSSAAGDIPRGKGRGTVIFAPHSIVGKIVAALAHLIAWQGKVFDPDKDELLNLITPFGLRKIRAQVYKQASWLDEKECIVLDYSKTSTVARWIRDEIREVSDGVYLGLVFWGKRRVLKFALEFPTS